MNNRSKGEGYLNKSKVYQLHKNKDYMRKNTLQFREKTATVLSEKHHSYSNHGGLKLYEGIHIKNKKSILYFIATVFLPQGDWKVEYLEA